MRFDYIKTIEFEHEGFTQELEVYWDNVTNAPFALDSSYVEQAHNFVHPYTNERIVFDDYDF